MTTSAAAPAPVPTLTVKMSPTALTAGQSFTLTWSTTNATSLTRVCTASGTGYNVNESLAVNGSKTQVALAAWAGYPSTCTWTATGSGGTTTRTQTLSVPSPLPTIVVQRSPATMTAGEPFTLTWTTTNATSVTRACTASGTGFTSSGAMPATSSTQSGTASAAWVGYPSSCTWTATGSAGTAKYVETVTTVAASTGNVTYIHTDGLGSPVARTDAARNVISRTRYEPYGYVASGTTPTIGFTGHVNDSDTGLTYMQQRYYDPVAGRFLSIDPVISDTETGNSFNRYAYADNNPYRYIDPDGRNPIGFLVRLLDNGGKKLGRALDKSEAVAARRAGKNVQATSKSNAKEIEVAARNGNKEGVLKHKGHELKDGSTGDPHFQTEGVSGHTFWGRESGAVSLEILEALAVPIFATPSTLAPGTLYGPGTQYENAAAFENALKEKSKQRKADDEERPIETE